MPRPTLRNRGPFLRCCAAAALMLSIVLWGCEAFAPKKTTTTKPATQPVKQETATRPWSPLDNDHFRGAVQRLGPLPNSGLLLPEVSPDGRWVAFLKTDLLSRVRPTTDGLFTG